MWVSLVVSRHLGKKYVFFVVKIWTTSLKIFRLGKSIGFALFFFGFPNWKSKQVDSDMIPKLHLFFPHVFPRKRFPKSSGCHFKDTFLRWARIVEKGWTTGRYECNCYRYLDTDYRTFSSSNPTSDNSHPHEKTRYHLIMSYTWMNWCTGDIWRYLHRFTHKKQISP